MNNNEKVIEKLLNKIAVLEYNNAVLETQLEEAQKQTEPKEKEGK